MEVARELLDADMAVDSARTDARLRGAPLSGRVFEFRPVSRERLPFLYALSTDETVGFRWRFRGAVPAIEGFEATLWQGVHAQFVVVVRATGEPAGLVVSYGADLANGFTHVGAVYAPGIVGKGLSLEPSALFLAYLFHTWPLRKVYFEVAEFNLTQFRSGIGRYIWEEGRLRDHEYYGGRYWDKVILAMYREDSDRLSSLVRRRAERHSQPSTPTSRHLE